VRCCQCGRVSSRKQAGHAGGGRHCCRLLQPASQQWSHCSSISLQKGRLGGSSPLGLHCQASCGLSGCWHKAPPPLQISQTVDEKAQQFTISCRKSVEALVCCASSYTKFQAKTTIPSTQAGRSWPKFYTACSSSCGQMKDSASTKLVASALHTLRGFSKSNNGSAINTVTKIDV